MCGYILQDITVNILSAAAPQDIAQSRCRGLTGSITSAWRFQYTLSAKLALADNAEKLAPAGSTQGNESFNSTKTYYLLVP